MQDVWATISRSQAVVPGSVTQWSDYITGYAMHRKWPRYYMSSADMSAAMGRYRWVVVDDCLVILKWVSMGGLKIHLAVPPMSKHGDVQAELRVLEWLTAAGVGARLSAEDVSLYGVPCVECPTGPEFIFTPSDYEGLAGAAWANWRNALNVAKRRGLGVVTTVAAVPHEALQVTKEWAEGRKKNGSHETRIASNPSGIPQGWANAITLGDRTVAWSAYQHLVGSMATYIASHWCTDVFQGMDAAIYLHATNMRVAGEMHGRTTMLNMGGGAGDKGLMAAKRKLRPHHELQVYRTTTPRPITKADWEASRQFAKT